MTEIQTLVENFEASIHDRYMDACNAKGAAVDPADLDLPTWAEDLLATSFEVALKIEGVMQARQIGWNDASDFV